VLGIAVSYVSNKVKTDTETGTEIELGTEIKKGKVKAKEKQKGKEKRKDNHNHNKKYKHRDPSNSNPYPPFPPEAIIDPTPSLLNHDLNLDFRPREGVDDPLGGDPPTFHVQRTRHADVRTPMPRPGGAGGGFSPPPPPSWIDMHSDSSIRSLNLLQSMPYPPAFS